MSLFLLFSLLGAGFLLVLYAFLTRTSSSVPEGSAQSLLVAHHALTRLQQTLLAPQTLECIFSESDLDFVLSVGCPEVHDLFLLERRRVALLWVAQIRGEILSLMRFHRSQSGFYADLSPLAELSLIAGFWSLLILCRSLQFLIYLRGPFAARATAARAVTAAGRLCCAAGKPIVSLNTYSTGLNTPGDGSQVSE